MKFHPVLIVVGLCVAFVPAYSQVPEKDTQNWNDIQLTIPLRSK